MAGVLMDIVWKVLLWRTAENVVHYCTCTQLAQFRNSQTPFKHPV